MKQLANKLKLARILNELLMNINLVSVGLSITEEAAQLGLSTPGGPWSSGATQTCASEFCVLPPVTTAMKVTSQVPDIELLQRPVDERLVVSLVGLEHCGMPQKFPLATLVLMVDLHAVQVPITAPKSINVAEEHTIVISDNAGGVGNENEVKMEGTLVVFESTEGEEMVVEGWEDAEGANPLLRWKNLLP